MPRRRPGPWWWPSPRIRRRSPGWCWRASPVLSDADLVDCAAVGDEAGRTAIAGRPHLSAMLCGALAEIAGAASLRVLAGNPGAEITRGSLLRMVERHGDDASLREALLARADLPIDVRQAVTARLAGALSAFVSGCGWLSPERSERVTREARERATLGLAEASDRADLRRPRRASARGGPAHGRADPAGAAVGPDGLHRGGPDRSLGPSGGTGGGAAARSARQRPHRALPPAFGLPPALEPALRGGDVRLARGSERLLRERRRRPVAADDRARRDRLRERLPFADAHAIVALLNRFDAEAARDEARILARALVSEATIETGIDTVPEMIPAA